ncbi:MAG: DUF4178 domain-containing protein [Pseudomonadota bacterium]
MLDATCPSCGAAIHFQTADLPAKVCDYCRSLVMRNGDQLEAIGTVAEVPEDVSPLRIGTRGSDGGMGFELIGRVRWRWSDGGWNEWLALFDDGSSAWLSEAMGRYMLLRAVEHGATRTEAVKRLREGQKVSLGTKAIIDGIEYRVTDIKDVTCVASEGELPFRAPAGLKIVSVDLMAGDGHCASLQKEDGDVSVYAGRYVSLAELRATGLRAFDGWPMPQYAA